MRIATLLFLGTFTLGTTSPSFLAISGGIKMLLSVVEDAWKIAGDFSEIPLPLQSKNKQHILLERVYQLADSIEVVQESVHVAQAGIVAKILHAMTKTIKIELRMNDLVQHISKIDAAYHHMTTYAKYKEHIENATLIDFAESVLSHDVFSVRFLLDRVHHFVDSDVQHNNLINLMSDGDLDASSICIAHQSPHQLLYSLYQSLELTEMKGYAMIQFSYMLLKLYGKGNYTKESEIEKEKFVNRSLRTSEKMREALAKASRHLWECDPKEHKDGETYLEITQLLQGYLQNEVDLNNDGSCRENCAAYQYTKSHSCYQNLYCRQQRRCQGKILNCRFVASDMTVCPSNVTTKRRYEYIEYENGKVYGQKISSCPKGKIEVESWWRWLFWHCSYCMCLCDEEGIFSDRYISMKPALSDMTNNKVVTGLKFTKKNRIIHLQIQEGELLAEGNIDQKNVTWVPVDSFLLNERGVYKDQTYFTLSWNTRAIDLDVLEGREDHVLTGVRFQKIGSHLNFQIRVTPFDFATGKLIPQMSEWADNLNTEFTPGAKRTKIELSDTDVPTRARTQSQVRSTHNQFLEFTHTSFDRDAAQTTVPFFDAQSVRSKAVPNSGAGIYFKSAGDKSGGFLGLKLVTYDYSKHLLRKDDFAGSPAAQ